MKVLVNTKNLSKKEWLQYRRMGIGGSDVSVLAGINPYKSIHQLWLEKTGQIDPEDTENDYTHFGNVLEPIIRKEFMERTGLKVRQRKQILQSEKFDFVIADLDGVLKENDELVIFEAKTATEHKKGIWRQGVPFAYILQVQHYMFVTGARKAYVAALVGGNHFYIHEVLRDEELIKEIIDMETKFWMENVIGGVEPVMDGSKATTAYLNERYSEGNGTVIPLPEETLAICDQYDAVSKELERLKTEKDALTNQLKGYLKENEGGIVGDRRIMWTQVNKTSFDQKRLEQEQPEIYRAYLSQSHYRRFSVA